MSVLPQPPHGGDRVIAFIDFVKSLRWPAVAVLLLVLLLDPIRTSIQALHGQGDGASVVRLGNLPLRVSAQTLPQPNEEIVRAVAAMDADVLRTFLDMDQNAIYCGSLDAEYRAGMRRLAHLGLVEARSDPARPSDCRDYAVMTELGKRVETYLISVMVGMLKG
ncbi:hypothetical protein [Elioraea tepidiphila]|jgi:hypothetical protein|uniref:hypothetical protein n=1 Tax=Elioraea tepidiphila TaxID=457934 RepID=UPI0004761102|nr:hypothetical protein [Elioraea tepidiphila]